MSLTLLARSSSLSPTNVNLSLFSPLLIRTFISLYLSRPQRDVWYNVEHLHFQMSNRYRISVTHDVLYYYVHTYYNPRKHEAFRVKSLISFPPSLDPFQFYRAYLERSSSPCKLIEPSWQRVFIGLDQERSHCYRKANHHPRARHLRFQDPSLGYASCLEENPKPVASTRWAVISGPRSPVNVRCRHSSVEYYDCALSVSRMSAHDLILRE